MRYAAVPGSLANRRAILSADGAPFVADATSGNHLTVAPTVAAAAPVKNRLLECCTVSPPPLKRDHAACSNAGRAKSVWHSSRDPARGTRGLANRPRNSSTASAKISISLPGSGWVLPPFLVGTLPWSVRMRREVY